MSEPQYFCCINCVLQPNPLTQSVLLQDDPYMPSQGGLVFLPAQIHEHGGDPGRQALHEESWKGTDKDNNQKQNRICSFMRGGTGGATRSYKGTGVHVSDQPVRNRLHEDGTRPLVGQISSDHSSSTCIFLFGCWPEENWSPD